METAFCSYQESTMERGSSFTPHPNASARAHRNLDRAVSIVALSHIHKSWKPTDGSKVQIVKSVFSTCKCKNYGIRRCLLYKFGIVIASSSCAVAASYQEKVADMHRILQHRLPDLQRQDTVPCPEAGCNRSYRR